MLTCWDGGGRLLRSQTPIWFYLIVLNKMWHTHISSCHPMVVGLGGNEVGGSEVNVLIIKAMSVIKSPYLHLVWCADGGVS